MPTTFIVKRNNEEACCIMQNADVYLRKSKNKNKWTIIVENTLDLEIIHLPRRDIAIEEFNRIAREVQNGATTVVIEEKAPM